MTMYEYYMNKSNESYLKAIEARNKGDENMMNFWKNASCGFKEKALNLNLGY